MNVQLGLFPDEPLIPECPEVGPAAVSELVVSTAQGLSDQLRLGTSSWSFPGWEGIVYDRQASQSVLSRHGLGAYGAHPLLRTVGLDRTYYRSITSEAFRAYADLVPEDFRFLVKADRQLTSPLNPDGYGVRDANPRFLDPGYAIEEVIAPMTEGLGEKAGPLLFQFSSIPANLVGGRGAFLDRLHRFVEALPTDLLYAIELRTPAFLTAQYAQLLEGTGAAHCYNVHPAMSPLERQLEIVSPFYQPALVVRWMLHAGLKYEVAKDRYAPFNHLMAEDGSSRERIAVTVLDALIAERSAFVIVNNKAEGSAPLSIFKLAERIASWDSGLPGRKSDAS